MRASFTVAAMLLTGLATIASAAEPTYVGAEVCKPCHLPEYNSWHDALHVKATESAKAADGFTPECLRCHATDASESFPGVQCESCHGPGSLYKPIPVMFDQKKAVALGLEVPSQATCDRCHDGDDHHAKVEFNPDFHKHRERRPVKDIS